MKYRPVAWALGIAPLLGLVICLCARSESQRISTRRAAVSRQSPSTHKLPQIAVLLSGTFEGHVVSGEGTSIPRARVCAELFSSRVVGKPRVTCVESDALGAYRLSIPRGAYVITAAASGFLPASANTGRPIPIADSEEKAGVDILLQHGGVRVAGSVLDVTGGSVAGAAIRVTWLDVPKATVLTESGRDGTFVLWGRPGRVVFHTDADGYVATVVHRVIPTGSVVIELTPASVVAGQVVSADDRTPVPDISVWAVALGRRADAFGISDSAGFFRISGLEPGVFALTAEGAGWRGSSNGPLKLGLADTISNVTVTVSSVARVSGVVLVRLDSSPCIGGAVTLGPTGPRTLYDPPSLSFDPDLSHRSHVPPLSAPIEPDGTVSFPAVPAGVYHAIVMCDGRTLVQGPSIVEVGRTDVNDLLWKVDTGIGMMVHMVDEADNPLPGAVAWLKSSVSPMNREIVGDVNGQYEQPCTLYPGTYTLTPGHGGSDGDPTTVELRGDVDRVDVTVRFNGKYSIVARVEDTESEPIDDLDVRALSVVEPGQESPTRGTAVPIHAEKAGHTLLYDSVPLGNGTFRIGHLRRGKYRVQANDGVNPPFEAGGAGHTVDVASAIVNVTIMVDRGAIIRGRVVDPSGEPMPDSWVSASCKASDSERPSLELSLGHKFRPFASRRTVSDKDGQFVLRGLEEGIFCSVRAEQPFGMVGEKGDVRPGVHDLIVALAPAGEANGTTSPRQDRH